MEKTDKLTIGTFHRDFSCNTCKKIIKTDESFIANEMLTFVVCYSCFEKEKERMKRTCREEIEINEHNLKVIKEFEKKSNDNSSNQ